MSTDPIIMIPDNGQSLNPYSNVMNNPLKFNDPSGYVLNETSGAKDSKKDPVCDDECKKKKAKRKPIKCQTSYCVVYIDSNGNTVYVPVNVGNGATNGKASAKDETTGSTTVKDKDSGSVKVELLIGGPYTDKDGNEVAYGHVALRVYGETEYGAFDLTYDFGRYGAIRGPGGSEGDGMLRVWTNFNKYIAGENATGRTTTGYVFSISAENTAKIIRHFNSLTSGVVPGESRGDYMTPFKLKTDYHAANCNCTTVAMQGLKAGNAKLYDILNQNKFDQGRGLSWLQGKAYSYGKSDEGVRLPMDLKAAVKQYGKTQTINTYKW